MSKGILIMRGRLAAAKMVLSVDKIEGSVEINDAIHLLKTAYDFTEALRKAGLNIDTLDIKCEHLIHAEAQDQTDPE